VSREVAVKIDWAITTRRSLVEGVFVAARSRESALLLKPSRVAAQTAADALVVA
jgi:hypothetical protein